jgi:hypothetical protein
MTVRESRVGKEHRMAFAREKLRQTKYGLWHWPIAALAIGAVMWFQMLPAGAHRCRLKLPSNQPDKLAADKDAGTRIDKRKIARDDHITR